MKPNTITLSTLSLDGYGLVHEPNHRPTLPNGYRFRLEHAAQELITRFFELEETLRHDRITLSHATLLDLCVHILFVAERKTCVVYDGDSTLIGYDDPNYVPPFRQAAAFKNPLEERP